MRCAYVPGQYSLIHDCSASGTLTHSRRIHSVVQEVEGVVEQLRWGTKDKRHLPSVLATQGTEPALCCLVVHAARGSK